MNSLKISRFHAKLTFTMREFDMTLDWERKLLIAFVLLSLGTLLGPFGTYDIMGIWDRLTFWCLDIIGAALLMHVIVGTIYNSSVLISAPPMVRFMAGVAIAAVPTSAWIRFVFLSMVGPNGPGIHFPRLWAEVVAVSAVVLWIEYDLLPRARRARGSTGRKAAPLFSSHPHIPNAQVTPPEPDATPTLAQLSDQAPLLDRLPDEARPGKLISISMQDHYAAITMTTGTFLLLMRLSDALQLLGEIPGAQIHRSHWAAAEFAKELTRKGRRMRLQLTDGRSLPVSASYLKVAKKLVGAAPKTVP